MRLLKNAWFIGAFALAIRVGVVLAAGESGHSMGDTRDYLDAAQAIRDGQPYPESSGLPFWRPPGYPAVIALVWTVFPGSLLALLLVQCAVDVFGLFLLGSLVQRSFGDTASSISRWWYALYPPFIMHAATIQTETWFQVGLLALALALLPEGRTRPRRGRLVAGGIILAVATLVRPAGLLILPLLLVWLVAFWSRDRAARSVLADVAVLSAAFFLTLLPWAARNHAVHGEWILVTEAGWFNVWYTTTPAAGKAMSDPARAKPALDSLLTVRIPSMREGWAPVPLSERRAFWREQALANIAEDPGAFVRYRLYGLYHTWRPWATPGFYSTRSVIASIAVFLPWLVLGWLGVVEAWRMRPGSRPFVGVVLAFAAVAMASNLIGTPVIRYRIPLIDPYFLGMASSWLALRLDRSP